MKILFLTMWDDSAEGGGQVTMWNLISSLEILSDYSCVVLSTHSGDGIIKDVGNGIPIWRVGLKNIYRPSITAPSKGNISKSAWHTIDSFNLLMQKPLREVLQAERPDLVSVHQINGWSPLAWKTIAEFNIPIVNVLHAYESLCPKATMYREGHGNCVGQCAGCRLLRLPHRFLSRKVSAVVGVSRYILDRHLQAGYFAGVPIQRVIHNARDPGKLGVLDAPPRAAGEALRFGYMGRLEAAKGIAPLLEAFTAAALPQAELWVAGNGKPEVVEPLRQRYAQSPVRFLGRVAPRDFYPHIDVMVVPSVWNEPLGMVVAEALAFGKPVIGSRRGGIPEMIRAGENGLLFEPDRPGELVAALRQLAGDATLRARMGEGARASARPFLDRDGWIAQYQVLYEQIAQRPLQ